MIEVNRRVLWTPVIFQSLYQPYLERKKEPKQILAKNYFLII